VGIVMKSVVISRTGGPEVLQWIDRDLPNPKPHAVRIRPILSGKGSGSNVMAKKPLPHSPVHR
jgi:NADPH:quinone reductase-like Zn-dependent oxidoreductase